MDTFAETKPRTALIEFNGDLDKQPEVKVSIDNRGNIINATAWAPGLLKWVDCTRDVMVSDWWRKRVNERYLKINWDWEG